MASWRYRQGKEGNQIQREKLLISRNAFASPTFPVFNQVQQYPHNRQLFLRWFERVPIPITVIIHFVLCPPKSVHRQGRMGGWGSTGIWEREKGSGFTRQPRSHFRFQVLRRNLPGITLSFLRSTLCPQTKYTPQRKKDQQQVLTRWWKRHTFPSHTEIQERLQQLGSHVPTHLTSPGNTSALLSPHASPRLEEEDLRHDREGHKKKRKSFK